MTIVIDERRAEELIREAIASDPDKIAHCQYAMRVYDESVSAYSIVRPECAVGKALVLAGVDPNALYDAERNLDCGPGPVTDPDFLEMLSQIDVELTFEIRFSLWDMVQAFQDGRNDKEINPKAQQYKWSEALERAENFTSGA